MIRQLDAAERILRPLSELIGKPLRVAEAGFTGEETLISEIFEEHIGTLAGDNLKLAVVAQRIADGADERIGHVLQSGGSGRSRRACAVRSKTPVPRPRCRMGFG